MGATTQSATAPDISAWALVDESSTTSNVGGDAVSRIAQAIQKAEGTDDPDSLGARLNNPGNLKVGDVGYGTTPDGKTRFGSVVDGLKRLHTQIEGMLDGTSKMYGKGDSIAKIAPKWTGNDNPEGWAATVARELGVKTGDSLTSPVSAGSATSSGAGGDASQWTEVDESKPPAQPSLASRLLSTPTWGKTVLDDPRSPWYEKVAAVPEDLLENLGTLPTAAAATALAPPETPSEKSLAASPYVHTPGVNVGGQAAVAAKRLVADPFMSETAKMDDPTMSKPELLGRLAASPFPGVASTIEGAATRLGTEGLSAAPTLLDQAAGAVLTHAIGGELGNPPPVPGPREAAMNAVKRITGTSMDDNELRSAMQTTEAASKGLDYFNGKDLHGNFVTGHIDAQGTMTDLRGDPIDPRSIVNLNRTNHATPRVEALTTVASRGERATSADWSTARDPYAGFSTRFTIPGSDHPASVIELDHWITGRNTELKGKLGLEGLRQSQAENHPTYGPQLRELRDARAALNETVSGLSGVDSAAIRERWANVADLKNDLSKVTGPPGSTLPDKPFSPYLSEHGVLSGVMKAALPERYGDLDALASHVGKEFRKGAFGEPETQSSPTRRPLALPPGNLITPSPADASFVQGAPAGLDVQYPGARALPAGRPSLVTPYRGEPAGSEPTGVMNQGYPSDPQPLAKPPLAPRAGVEVPISTLAPAEAEAEYQEWLRQQVAKSQGRSR